jgi:glutamate racemase
MVVDVGDDRPIGVFDSGVGGLSVWREIRRFLPDEPTTYLADQAHVPYGPRPPGEVRAFSLAIARFLIEDGCKAVVVACNTASTAALRSLRETFPETPFIGMEPAVKPAAAISRSGVVGVLATEASVGGPLLADVIERHAGGARILSQACPGLVEAVETGRADAPETLALLGRILAPLLSEGADTLVLACTHYPFLADAIRRLADPGLTVIDPAPAIARQLGRVLERRGLARAPAGPPRHTLLTSGPAPRLAAAAGRLVGWQGSAEGLAWAGGVLMREAAPAAGSAFLPALAEAQAPHSR